MSETIVTIVALRGKARLDHIGFWDIDLQIVKTDMTQEEASQAFRDKRQYRLVEVFDQEPL